MKFARGLGVATMPKSLSLVCTMFLVSQISSGKGSVDTFQLEPGELGAI